MIQETVTVLYRNPGKVFAAADRGEVVILTRGKSKYEIRRNRARGGYGSLAGSITAEKGNGSRRGRPLKKDWWTSAMKP